MSGLTTLVLAVGIVAAFFGGMLTIWAGKGWIINAIRVLKLRLMFRPAPPAHKYHVVRVDIPTNDHQ